MVNTMRFLLILLWGLGFLFFSGCHDHPHQNETQDEPHLQAYLKLKKKSPDSALIELKAHANITFKAHPRSNDWAELAARLDRVGKASLLDMQRLSQLVLEMARDNKASTAYIQLEKELKTEGTDPTTFFVKFTLRLTEKK